MEATLATTVFSVHVAFPDVVCLLPDLSSTVLGFLQDLSLRLQLLLRDLDLESQVTTDQPAGGVQRRLWSLLEGKQTVGAATSLGSRVPRRLAQDT